MDLATSGQLQLFKQMAAISLYVFCTGVVIVGLAFVAMRFSMEFAVAAMWLGTGLVLIGLMATVLSTLILVLFSITEIFTGR